MDELSSDERAYLALDLLHLHNHCILSEGCNFNQFQKDSDQEKCSSRPSVAMVWLTTDQSQLFIVPK